MDLFSMIVGVVIGAALAFLASYVKKKGENRANLEDSNKMTTLVKVAEQPFELESHKRKSRYDKKSEEYHRYFLLLDHMSKTNNDYVYEKFLPEIASFHERIIGASTNEDFVLAIGHLNESLSKLLEVSSRKLVSFMQETASIKLIASEQTIELLNQVGSDHEKFYQYTSKLITDMMNMILANDWLGLNKIFEEVRNQERNQASESNGTHLKLIAQMRVELDEI